MLETIRIAATLFSYVIEYKYQVTSDHNHQLDITFKYDNKRSIDSLVHCIAERSVDRRRYERAPLTEEIKTKLSNAVGDEFAILWLEKFQDRYALAKLTMIVTSIRMSMPELYPIHRNVFKLDEKYAQEGMPIEAIGMNIITRLGMKWAMKSWKRMKLMNYLGAIQVAQIELDLLPGICCSAHFMLIPKNKDVPMISVDCYIRAGAAMQRFWLEATSLGLVMQPNFAPLVLSYYADNNIAFTKCTNLVEKAKKISTQLHTLDKSNTPLFMGRIGYPKRQKPSSRSIRLPLCSLIIDKEIK